MKEFRHPYFQYIEQTIEMELPICYDALMIQKGGSLLLIVAQNLSQLDFRQLMDVYEEGNRENAREFFPDVDENLQMLLAEQEFHQYLRECFFKTTGARYYIWEENRKYVSALRLEPYQDGLLLEALETAPHCRKMGYATNLIRAVLLLTGKQKIYSHVSKRNKASLKTHEKCGFQRILEHAIYADGSVLSTSCTMCYEG